MLERDSPAVSISKDLVAASAVPLVLSILREGDSYGYAIIRRVAELSEGRLQWTEGMLYPVLHRLEDAGARRLGVAGRRELGAGASTTASCVKVLPSWHCSATSGTRCSRRCAGRFWTRGGDSMFDLDARVREWTDSLRSRGAFRAEDIVELESHLRDEIDALAKTGLSAEEAFLVAEHRVGRPDALGAEYAKVHGEPWRGMAFDTLTDSDRSRARRDLVLAGVLALAAALLAQVPRLFGAELFALEPPVAWMKNISLFFMPLAAVFYAVRGPGVAPPAGSGRGSVRMRRPPREPLPVAGCRAPAQTLLLAALHLPVMLWLVVGLVYAAERWREDGARMDFLRATGEAFIYGTLVICGGAVLTLFTALIFSALGVEIMQPYLRTVGIGGVVAAPVVAVFLVSAKKSIVENIAPVLSRIFTPLFLATMLAFLAVMAMRRTSPLAERDTLLAFNVMLILVLALVIYNLTARRSADRRTVMDWLNLALIACAAAVDAVALVSIAGRILTLRMVTQPGRAARPEPRTARRSRRPRRDHRAIPGPPDLVRRHRALAGAVPARAVRMVRGGRGGVPAPVRVRLSRARSLTPRERGATIGP